MRGAILLVAGWAAILPAHAQAPAFPYDLVWVAESLDQTPFAQTSRPTFQLTRANVVDGSTGCNRFRGTKASITDNTINLGPMMMTRRGCFGAGATNERLFGPAIGSVKTWRLEGKSLVMETDRGVLKFRRR